MERKERTNLISLRVPEGLLYRIEKDIETNGDHASRADWIIAAIREYEKQRTQIIAQRKIAESETQKSNASELGSADCCTSTANDASNRSEARIW